MTYLLLFLTLVSGYLEETSLERPVSEELPADVTNVTRLVYDWAHNTRQILLGEGYIPTGPCNREFCSYYSCGSQATVVVKSPWVSILTSSGGEVRGWFSGFRRELALVAREGRLDFDIVYRQRCYGDLPIFSYPCDQDPEIDCSEILRWLPRGRPSLPLSSPYSSDRVGYLPLRRAKTPWEFVRSRIHGTPEE